MEAAQVGLLLAVDGQGLAAQLIQAAAAVGQDLVDPLAGLGQEHDERLFTRFDALLQRIMRLRCQYHRYENEKKSEVFHKARAVTK